MATPRAISDGVAEGAPGLAEATSGEEARHGAVAAAASSPSRSLLLAPELPAAAGGQARPTLQMAAASSPSRSLPAAAGSEAYRTPATSWVILWRFLRADSEVEDAPTGAEAQAQPAAAAAAPHLTLPPALPPMVTVVSAGPGAHPDPNHPDELPFLLYADHLGLLLEIMAPCPFNDLPFSVNPTTYINHLMLARHFHKMDGQITATVERVMDRTGDLPAVKSFESIVLASNDMGEYLIAELQVDDEYSDAKIIYLESGMDEWNFKIMECPLMLNSRKKNNFKDRKKWVAHGSASDGRMLWWFDLSWGLICYDTSVSIREADELVFHELPDHRVLAEATRDIHTQRCITISQNKLRYVEIILEDEAGVLIMWTWSCIPSGYHWVRRYAMSFEDLWNGDSYKRSRLPRKVPVLSVVCPSNPDLVYFSMGHQLFAINVPELRVEHDGVCQLVNLPGPPRLASSRYLVPWELPSLIRQDTRLENSTFPADDETVSAKTEKDTILSVWKHNLHDAFSQIQNLMRIKNTNWIIGMDTEFCSQDLPEPPWMSPPFGDESYSHMRWSVDDGDLLQVGIAITDWDHPQERHVFQFNLYFDPTTRPSNSSRLSFLKNILQLEEHATKGIIVDEFIDQLRICGLLNNPAVTWITYQGFSDYGYLLRGLERSRRMPPNREEFLNSINNIFPNSYDLKAFHQIGWYCNKSEKGRANFETLSMSLGAHRFGTAHTAGSDALLTVSCFSIIASRQLPFSPILKLNGVLFRLSPLELAELPASCDRHVRVVTVDSRNFQRERTEMHNLFPLYGIISAELKLSSKEQIRSENYDTACQDLASITALKVEVVIAISDPLGWPAYGKLWKFSFNKGDNSFNSGMLVELLVKTGAISNPALTWISSEVGFFVYLVNALTTTSLPSKRHQFNTLISGFFPRFFIVPAGPEESESDPASKVLLTLRRFLQGSNAGNLKLRETLF